MSEWVIAFTGHRNKMTNNASLLEVYLAFKNVKAKWIHGGAQGFDSQVQGFIEYHDIPFEVFEPEYEKYPDRPKYAPLARNFHMVDICTLLVTCYDGRKDGGTFETIKYAKELGRPIKHLKVFSWRKGQPFII